MAGAGQSGPFTGAHDGLINKTEVQPLLGDIVVYDEPADDHEHREGEGFTVISS